MGNICSEPFFYRKRDQLIQQNIFVQTAPNEQPLFTEKSLQINTDVNYLQFQSEKVHNSNEIDDMSLMKTTFVKSPMTRINNFDERNVQFKQRNGQILENKAHFTNNISPNYYLNLINKSSKKKNSNSNKNGKAKIGINFSQQEKEKLQTHKTKIIHESTLTGLDLSKISIILGKYNNKNNVNEINHILKDLYGILDDDSEIGSTELLKDNRIQSNLIKKTKISQFECYNQANLIWKNGQQKLRSVESGKINLKSLISIDVLNDNDKNILIIDGDLFKYHPGSKCKFIKKWCCSSKNNFQYFKNQYSAKCYHHKPILSIPIKSIQNVSQINNNFFSTINGLETCDLYLFEIVLKINTNIKEYIISKNSIKLNVSRNNNGDDDVKNLKGNKTNFKVSSLNEKKKAYPIPIVI